MALNQPYEIEEWELEDVITNNLYELIAELKKENVEVEIKDFIYELFSRCEFLGVKSEVIYPDEDLPEKFGVHRGYNGGGIHSSLIKTEVYRMKKNRQKKAERLLNLFQKYFWKIIQEIDELEEAVTGEEKQAWEKLSL